MQGDPQSALASYHDVLRRRTEARASGLKGTVSSTRLPPERGSRQGTLEASITAVRLYDHSDRPVEKLESGQGLRIELTYHLSHHFDDMALLVGIHNETHVKCFETSVPSMATTFGTLSSDGTIICMIKSLPLLSGQYYVNVGLYPTDWSFIYDYQWRMHSLHISSKRELAHASGVVSMDVAWSSRKDQPGSPIAPSH
jgi:lipopolysaccharide transport system ATP-binding protein